MKHLRFRALSICLFVLLWLKPGLAEMTVDDFRMEIEVQGQQFQAGDRLEIKCLITNVSNHKLSLPFEESLLRIQFSYQDGREVPRVVPRGPSLHYISMNEIELEPGERFERVISGQVVQASRKVYRKSVDDIEEVHGIFVDWEAQPSVYMISGPISVYAEYDFFDALEWRHTGQANPNRRIEKVEDDGTGLTVRQGTTVEDPVRLKSNAIRLNIRE